MLDTSDDAWYLRIWDHIESSDSDAYPKTQFLKGKYTWGFLAFTLAEQDLINSAHEEAIKEDMFK